MKKKSTRINFVIQEVHSKIASRTYFPGTRLPSVRAQAKRMQVSVSTVVEAYERLMAEGVIISRPGSGFYIVEPIAPLALTQIEPRLDREIDPLWVSRQSLEINNDVIKPGCGWLPASWLYETGIRRALRTLSKAETLDLVEYATPLGHLGLRQLLVRRLANFGIETVAEQIMLTESGTQALDLICRFLLEPDDTVLVDDPCYFNFHALLKAHRVKVIGVPYTTNGPDITCFENALREHNPRLYITNSGIHNPTGAILSPVIAHRLLKLIDNTNLVIVEDDAFTDFEVSPAPRLAAFDGLSRVIQIGSFSKTISSSIRCGYIAAQKNWIEHLINLKISTSFGGGRLAAEIIFMTLTDSGYRRHMETVRLKLADEMAKTIVKLEEIHIKPWLVPQAGIFLWCQLPKGIDATIVAQECLKQGVVLAPGNVFSQSSNARDFLRFNIAQSMNDRTFNILKMIISNYWD